MKQKIYFKQFNFSSVSGVKDFNYVRLVATSALRSDCSIQGSVNGKNIIEIEDGGTIQNLIIGDGAKGVWCKGGCTFHNV